MGGERTACSLSTKNVLIESAYFNPEKIAYTGRKLKIDSDARYRFERGIDPNSIREGLEVATGLILSICGGQASKFVITGKTSQKTKIINFQPSKFEKLIGIPITINEIDKILSSLSFNCNSSFSFNIH